MTVRQRSQVHERLGAGLHLLTEFLGHGNKDAHDIVLRNLEQLAARRGLGEVRGEGLLLALDLGSDLGPLLVERARESGLLINSPRPSVLRFMPALNVSDAEIDTMVARLDALFDEGRAR